MNSGKQSIINGAGGDGKSDMLMLNSMFK